MTNPFILLTKEDCQKYSGKTVAIDMDTGKIVESAATAHVLRSKMQTYNPNVKYARITFPE